MFIKNYSYPIALFLFISALITNTHAANLSAGESTFRTHCTGCHTIGRGILRAPDLTTFKQHKAADFIANPEWFTTRSRYYSRLKDEYGYVMPQMALSYSQIQDVVAFMTAQTTPLEPLPPVTLTTTEFEETKDLYFNRCAGCHGLYRTGATGPNIGEVRSQWIGTDGLAALLRHGTPGGMPNFGTSNTLTELQITQMAAYLQLPPPEAPPLPMPEIEASWQLLVPVADRPTAPQHALDWENFIGVILRDAGKIALLDGTTKEEVVRIDVGFAVHILRSSSTGRYFYAIGRDGLVTLIDLWAAVPNIVATVKGCHDARSIDASKFPGYEDAFLIEGCYWPPQYVTFDGLTLEPLTRTDLPMTSITGETLPEVRVAAIVASPFEPLWVISLKESGYVGLVDYSQPGFPLVSTIATERFLHDGGWDHSKRYFMVAANASNKMVIVDVSERKLVATIPTGKVPHPGRGANWVDPVYGWVNATPHIGEGKISIYGTDPLGNPEHAWKVVREVQLPSSGSLFIKTHPNSPWVLIDMTLSTDLQKQVCAYAKQDAVIDRCFDVATNGRAVHFEFNKDGSEVWVSDWAPDGAVVILDSQTLTETGRVTGLTTPTGKFNVYNTAHDIY